MAERHLVVCGSGSPPTIPAAWRSVECLALRMGTGRADVHVGLGHLERRLAASVPPVFVDLLEVAAYVYAADQALTRGGPKEVDYGDRWRRQVHFEIPVRRLEIWNRPQVREALTECLAFLFYDHEFELRFRRLTEAPGLPEYFFDTLDPSGHVDCEEVILCSGGLDSLGGAVQEVLQGQRRVVLVGHNPVSKVVSRQRELADAIGNLVGDQRLRPVHVPVEVNKRKGLGRELTQRSRSFLFAAIAAPVARPVARVRQSEDVLGEPSRLNVVVPRHCALCIIVWRFACRIHDPAEFGIAKPVIRWH